jgi:hypothetical protein
MRYFTLTDQLNAIHQFSGEGDSSVGHYHWQYTGLAIGYRGKQKYCGRKGSKKRLRSRQEIVADTSISKRELLLSSPEDFILKINQESSNSLLSVTRYARP